MPSTVWDEITYPFSNFNGLRMDKWCHLTFYNRCNYLSMLGLTLNHKSIERHTAHTIGSWLNPEQWLIVHTSDFVMIIRQSIYIQSIVTREMDKLKTHSPSYCIMDNGENILNLTHTLDQIYLLVKGTHANKSEPTCFIESLSLQFTNALFSEQWTYIIRRWTERTIGEKIKLHLWE